MEGIGWVAGQGKPARANRKRWLVGWRKGDEEGRTAQSWPDWAALAIDGTVMANVLLQ